MKKIITVSVFAIVGAFLSVASVFAATAVSFTPSSVNVTAGQTFNVAISVNPSGAKDFAEKVQLQFPADLLKVNSFTLGGSWMALTTTGYDLVDNANGVIVKSAGYPGGISSATAFGTVSFTAKKSGSGSISLGSQSSAFVASGQSTISSSHVSFVVTDTTAVPVKTEVKPAVKPVVETPILKASSQEVASTTATTTKTNLTDINLPVAAAAEAIPTSGGNTWVWIVICALIVIVAGYGFYAWSKKGKNF